MGLAGLASAGAGPDVVVGCAMPRARFLRFVMLWNRHAWVCERHGPWLVIGACSGCSAEAAAEGGYMAG